VAGHKRSGNTPRVLAMAFDSRAEPAKRTSEQGAGFLGWCRCRVNADSPAHVAHPVLELEGGWEKFTQSRARCGKAARGNRGVQRAERIPVEQDAHRRSMVPVAERRSFLR
jgi:hypothetical protein